MIQAGSPRIPRPRGVWIWAALDDGPLLAADGGDSGNQRPNRTDHRSGNRRKHRRYYSVWLLYPLIFLLACANTINLGADIGAMGAAVRFWWVARRLVYAAVFAALCVLLQIFASYPKCSKVFKWLTLSLFSYVATVMVIHIPWKSAMKGTFLPSIGTSGNYWATIIAVFGTTISPYLFFWQASQETEEIRSKPDDQALKVSPEQSRDQFRRIRIDTYIGMAFSNLVAYSIILAAAATLNAHGVTDVQTSSQAAEAAAHCRTIRLFPVRTGNHRYGSAGGAGVGGIGGLCSRRVR